MSAVLERRAESLFTRLDEDPRIVRVYDEGDLSFLFQFAETFNFNAIVFKKCFSDEEQDSIRAYTESAKRNVPEERKMFRLLEFKSHFDKANRKAIPPRMRRLPMSPASPDFFEASLGVPEYGLSSTLKKLLFSATQIAYRSYVPDRSDELKALRKAMSEPENVNDSRLYQRFFAILRMGSTFKSAPHLHAGALLYNLSGEGTVCFDEDGVHPTYETQEGEMLLHDSTFWHGAPQSCEGNRLTYITGPDW